MHGRARALAIAMRLAPKGGSLIILCGYKALGLCTKNVDFVQIS